MGRKNKRTWGQALLTVTGSQGILKAKTARNNRSSGRLGYLARVY